MRRFVVVAVLVGSSVAAADPGPTVAAAEPPGMTGATDPTPPGAPITAPIEEPPHRDVSTVAPPAEPSPRPIDQPRSFDAAYDRAFAYGTALALEPGDFDISMRSVLRHGAMLGVAAGVGGNVELAVQGLKSSFLGEGVGTGVKITTVRQRRLAIAFGANIFAFLGNSEVGSGNSTRVYSSSVLLTTCVTGDCGVLWSASAGIAVSPADYGDAQILPTLDTSILFGTSWARPMFELGWLNGWMGFAGLRFGTRLVGVDAGLALTGDQAPGGSATAVAIGLQVRP